MIQLADGLDRFFQLVVVAQPTAHLRNLFTVDAELPGVAARIADGQNRLRMSFTAGAPGAATGVTGGALDKGAAQDLTRGGEAFEEPLASSLGLLVCHLYR